MAVPPAFVNTYLFSGKYKQNKDFSDTKGLETILQSESIGLWPHAVEELKRSIGITKGTIALSHSPLCGEVVTIKEKTQSWKNLIKRVTVHEQRLILDEEEYFRKVTVVKEEKREDKGDDATKEKNATKAGNVTECTNAGEGEGAKDGEVADAGKSVAQEGHVNKEESTDERSKDVGKGGGVDREKGVDKGKGVAEGKGVDGGENETAPTANKQSTELEPTRRRERVVTIRAKRVKLKELTDDRLTQYSWTPEMDSQGLLEVRVQGYDEGVCKWQCEAYWGFAQIKGACRYVRLSIFSFGDGCEETIQATVMFDLLGGSRPEKPQ